MAIIVKEGHKYNLKDTQSDVVQQIQFIERVNGELVQDGTTNEDVLEMLIDRIKWLNKKMPCRENSIVVTKLEESPPAMRGFERNADIHTVLCPSFHGSDDMPSEATCRFRGSASGTMMPMPRNGSAPRSGIMPA